MLLLALRYVRHTKTNGTDTLLVHRKLERNFLFICGGTTNNAWGWMDGWVGVGSGKNRNTPIPTPTYPQPYASFRNLEVVLYE